MKSFDPPDCWNGGKDPDEELLPPGDVGKFGEDGGKFEDPEGKFEDPEGKFEGEEGKFEVDEGKLGEDTEWKVLDDDWKEGGKFGDEDEIPVGKALADGGDPYL